MFYKAFAFSIKEAFLSEKENYESKPSGYFGLVLMIFL